MIYETRIILTETTARVNSNKKKKKKEKNIIYRCSILY